MGQVFEACLHDNCDVSLSGNWLRRAAKVYVTCHRKKDLGLSGDVSLFLLVGLGCAAKHYVVKDVMDLNTDSIMDAEARLQPERLGELCK
jgi:hypothetical protein